jgi:hypothetical protein
MLPIDHGNLRATAVGLQAIVALVVTATLAAFFPVLTGDSRAGRELVAKILGAGDALEPMKSASPL